MKRTWIRIVKQMPVFMTALLLTAGMGMFFAVHCAGAPGGFAPGSKSQDTAAAKEPKIRICSPEPEKSANAVGGIYYFNRKVSFSVTVTDDDLDEDGTAVFYTVTQDGRSSGHEVSFGSGSARKEGDAVYSVDIPVADGQELSGFRVAAKDRAGQEAEDRSLENYRYIVDTTAPKADIHVSGEGVESFFSDDTDVYVKFAQAAFSANGSEPSGPAQMVTLKITVTDRNIQTDRSEKYRNGFFVENDLANGVEWEGTAKRNTDSSVTYTQSMTVEPGDLSELYFKVTVVDLAGNAAADLSSDLPDDVKEKWHRNKQGKISGKVIGDLSCPFGGEDASGGITLIPNGFPAAVLDGGIPLYAGNMSYTLSVSDPVFADEQGRSRYSGLALVKWSVKTDRPDLICTADNEHFYNGEPSADLPVPVMINGTGETNDITVVVTVQDRAGNTAVQEQRIAMDNRPPRVTVRYDNQDARAGRYFNQGRTAHVTVEELNFVPDKTGFFTEGTVSGWLRDGDVSTASVSFEKDGDYRFEMFAEDKAGNSAPIDYSDQERNAAPQEFTVDLTRPEITVTFDPESSDHGKYYNRERTARISIRDHNFDAGAAKIAINAEPGKGSAAPKISGWTDNGDEQETTVVFADDGDYSGTVGCMDLAGNEADVYVINAFTIDRTPPKAVITGVRNGAGYAGPLCPRIRVCDNNFDEDGCDIAWTFLGRNETKEITLKDSGSEVWNARDSKRQGSEILFANREILPENDGIYRISAAVTDQAGNSAYLTDEKGTLFPDGILYSLNRFGSVYDADGEESGFLETRSLLDRKYTNEAPAIFVRESNPNALRNREVSITAGGTIHTLTEGEDYEVIREDEKEGAWKQYVYHIFPSSFRNLYGDLIQGEVTVTVSSEDAAGNLNSNRTNGKENGLDLSFVIDNEPPFGYLNISGLQEGKDTVRSKTAELELFWEDNSGVEEAEIWLNGKLEKTVAGEDLSKGFAALTVSESRKKQTAYAIVTDAAGNSTRLEPVGFFIYSGSRAFLSAGPILLFSVAAALAAVGIKVVLTVKRRKQRRNGTGQS